MIISLLYIFLGLNLVKLIMEKTNTIYKDLRFWLLLASFAALVWMTLKSYPIG
jgi:hypothetical protein